MPPKRSNADGGCRAFLVANAFNLFNAFAFIAALVAFIVVGSDESLPPGSSQTWCSCKESLLFTLKTSGTFTMCAITLRPRLTKPGPVPFTLDLTSMLVSKRTYADVMDGFFDTFEFPLSAFNPEACSRETIPLSGEEYSQLRARASIADEAIVLPWMDRPASCVRFALWGNVTNFVLYNVTHPIPESPWNRAVRWSTDTYTMHVIVLETGSEQHMTTQNRPSKDGGSTETVRFPTLDNALAVCSNWADDVPWRNDCLCSFTIINNSVGIASIAAVCILPFLLIFKWNYARGQDDLGVTVASA